MADETVITSCLNIMRRMPPNKIAEHLSELLRIVPDATDELLQRIDQPLHETTDPEAGRKYLLCDYNRDGDSYRSPWSNKYYPPLDDAFYPSDQLRTLEMEANELFDIYRELYYDGGTSSVYLWDLDHGFAGCFAIKKDVADNPFVKKGGWDSIHIVEVVPNPDNKSATYKLTTTVMLNMSVDNREVGDTNLSGSVTRQVEASHPLNRDSTHLSNIGRMIEDMEIQLRGDLDALYIQKTKEIVCSIRSMSSGPRQGDAHTRSLIDAVSRHRDTRKQDTEG